MSPTARTAACASPASTATDGSPPLPRRQERGVEQASRLVVADVAAVAADLLLWPAALQQIGLVFLGGVVRLVAALARVAAGPPNVGGAGAVQGEVGDVGGRRDRDDHPLADPERLG